jgi:ATP-binding cassette, subfamily B, bacterial MsbA
VKAFGAEGHEEERFRKASQRLYRTNLKVTSALALLPPLMELLGGVAVVGLIWYGSRQIAEKALTEGDFAAFVAAAFMMYAPIKKLSRVNATLQQAMAASERIFEILDTHSEVPERPGAQPLPRLRQAIEFRNVSFSYDGVSKTILKDVSFSVRTGQAVAIVGLSGAGKTTLVNLVPRFYDVSAGAILIDGIATTGVIFAAAYLLWALQRIIYNKLDKPENEALRDLSPRELAVMAPLLVGIVWLGLFPGPVLRRIEPVALKYIQAVRGPMGLFQVSLRTPEPPR